jgi:hypothetical protein
VERVADWFKVTPSFPNSHRGFSPVINVFELTSNRFNGFPSLVAHFGFIQPEIQKSETVKTVGEIFSMANSPG